MTVTVAICTWNRARLLDRTLTEMGNLRVPAGVDWELLVVDNNSPDDTAAVLARHAAAGRLPLKALFEPKQGQSHARNTAVAAAAGDLILWTDDDVLVGPDWVAKYADAAARFPDASYFGGPIRPWYEAPPPRWVTANLPALNWCWALVDHDSATRPLAVVGGHTESVHGANMAFRTAVMRRYPFDPALGHVGNGVSGGDEYDVFLRMWADGHHGVWVGDAPVNHYLPADRVTIRYYWRRLRDHTRVTANLAAVAGHRTWGGRLRQRRAAAAELGRAAARYALGNSHWLESFERAARHRGLLLACQDARPAE